MAPGLAYLRDLHADESVDDFKKRLKIGEVYFAGPDAEFKQFAGQYLKFRDIVDRTSINMNYNDSVLWMPNHAVTPVILYRSPRCNLAHSHPPFCLLFNIFSSLAARSPLIRSLARSL